MLKYQLQSNGFSEICTRLGGISELYCITWQVMLWFNTFYAGHIQSGHIQSGHLAETSLALNAKK